MSTPPSTTDAHHTLASVLDEIIPARGDGLLPGAGALGIADYVRERLGEAGAVIAAGLSALDQRAAGRGAASFGALPGEARARLLNEVAAGHPGFLECLIFHTYAGYYQQERVVEALGLEPRPPHPEGYELEPGDLSRLDAVRARSKLYRDA